MVKTSTLAIILAALIISVVFTAEADGAGLVKRAISTAGRWQPSDLPTPTVLSNTTNTYTAGQKQIFQSSGTTAAIKIVTTTDPSGVVQGDIWFNTNDLKWQGSSVTQTAERTANKGIASGYTPLNSISLIPSRFLGSGTNSSSNFLRGDNTWSSALVTSNIGTANNVTVSGATGAVTINLGSNVVTTGGQVQNVTKNLTLFGANTVKTSNTGLIVRNSLGTFATTIAGGAVTANRTLNTPVITGTDTMATLGLAQTFTAQHTFGTAADRVGDLVVSGFTSGTTVINATATAGTGFVTLPTSGILLSGNVTRTANPNSGNLTQVSAAITLDKLVFVVPLTANSGNVIHGVLITSSDTAARPVQAGANVTNAGTRGMCHFTSFATATTEVNNWFAVTNLARTPRTTNTAFTTANVAQPIEFDCAVTTGATPGNLQIWMNPQNAVMTGQVKLGSYLIKTP